MSRLAPVFSLLAACTLLVVGQDQAVVQRYRFNISHDEIFSDNKVIPLEHQVSEFLYKGETKMFFLYKKRKEGPLSITVTPCTSTIVWTVRYRYRANSSSDEAGDSEDEQHLGEFRGRELRTLSLASARPGLYVVRVSPLERESYVHLYASQQPGGPSPLTIRHKPHIKLQRRQRRKGLTVRWEPSAVDPHLMHYCLVVNPRRHYSTLCEARGERYGVTPPQSGSPGFNFPRDIVGAHKAGLANKAARLNSSRLGRGSGAETHEDIVVGCVGRKTQYTLCHLQPGKVYHLNLFAVNRRTNLSFSYGSTTLKYEQRPRPVVLKDGKRAAVNLRSLDGRASFKFKVGKTPGPQMQMYVMACGGSVDVRLRLDGQQMEPRRRVDGYGQLNVPTPSRGQRYTLQVSAPNREELRRVHTLEVLATVHADRFPLPQLPPSTRLHEYESLRSCSSVTLGWVPASDGGDSLRYCVAVRERFKDDDVPAKPNQCSLKRARARAPLFSHCMDAPTQRSGNVTTYEVKGLEPSRAYILQLTVQRPGGRPLSYDLLPVQTKGQCT